MQEICGIPGLSFKVMVGKKVFSASLLCGLTGPRENKDIHSLFKIDEQFVMNNQNMMTTIQPNPRHLIEKIKKNRNKDLNV